MKVSRKVKAFCYVGLNLGMVGSSILSFLDGTLHQKGALISLTSLVMMNALFWFMFRERDKESL